MSVDATNRPLLIPPEFANYAENHGIFELYQRLLKQLVIHKPVDPLTFLVEQLQKPDDDVPQILIMGPPASGKRSIARMICNKLRTAHITSDGLINEADAKLKDEAMSYIAANKEIPNDLWTKLVDQRLQLFDCVKKGYVMDGFPKTREQALLMQAKGITPKHVVLLQAPDTVLLERAAGKRVDPTTGEIYHTTFEWPSDPEVENRLETASGYSETELVEKLVLHHRHLEGILKCYDKAHKVVNADQPKADVFAQVMTFLASSPRSAAPHTPRVILLGPTGSGKAVQAALLANKYNVVNVSCGQLIKQAIADESKFGSASKPYVADGLMVPDSIVLSILKERLSQLDCVSRGWVLRGYPQTREQAEQLAYAGFVANRVYFLDVPNDSVIERLTMRATDPVTGNRYHALFNPPQIQDVKDRLQTHPKDDDEEVRKRLSAFNAYQEQLQDFYLDAQRINADQDPHTVFECIESMLVNPLPKQMDD